MKFVRVPTKPGTYLHSLGRASTIVPVIEDPDAFYRYCQSYSPDRAGGPRRRIVDEQACRTCGGSGYGVTAGGKQVVCPRWRPKSEGTPAGCYEPLPAPRLPYRED